MRLDPVRWYPVAASHDLPHGHVYQTIFAQAPLALWRAANGTVNVWEDRCPHRGVRLSVGNVVGNELRCQYHAWRFASKTGACIHIPAQPDRKPAAAVRATIWPVCEQDGLVWTALTFQSDPPPRLDRGAPLRAIPIARPAREVEAALATVEGAQWFVQPVTSERSVVRGLARPDASIAALDAILEAMRRALEAVE